MNAIEITSTDSDLIAKLAAANGQIVFRGPTGRVLGTFFLDGYGVPPLEVKSPFTAEQIEEARKSPSSGVTLAEFWDKVKRGEWKRITSSIGPSPP